MAAAGSSIRIVVDEHPPPTIVNVYVVSRGDDGSEHTQRSAVIAGDAPFAAVQAAVQYALHLR